MKNAEQSMIATSCFPYYKVESAAYPAPEVMTALIPEAKYMISSGAGHGVYALVPEEDEVVRPGQEFCHYYVDGCLYQAIYTTTGEEFLPVEEPADSTTETSFAQDEFYQFSLFDIM